MKKNTKALLSVLFQLLRGTQTVDGPVKVTTVYDLILANYGIDRGIGGENWRQLTLTTSHTHLHGRKITGVSERAIATARGADNAEKRRRSFHD